MTEAMNKFENKINCSQASDPLKRRDMDNIEMCSATVIKRRAQEEFEFN